MNEAQAIALAKKHTHSIVRLSDTEGTALLTFSQLTAMLTDHRAQVIEELAQQTGVVPASSPIHDAVYDVVIGHGYRGNEVREALAIMQAKLDNQRQEVIAELAQKTGAKTGLYDSQWVNCVNRHFQTPDISKDDVVNDAVKEAVKYCKTNADEALAAMQAKLEHLQDIASCYEELRKATDGGSESMTHEDAVESVKYLQATLEQWKNEFKLCYKRGESEKDELKARLEQAQADAARMREALKNMVSIHEDSAGFAGLYGHDLDAAISKQQKKIDASLQTARAALAAMKEQK